MSIEAQILDVLEGWDGAFIKQDATGFLIAGHYRGRTHAGHSGKSDLTPNDPVDYARHLHAIALREHEADMKLFQQVKESADANPEMVEPEQPAESDGGGAGTGDNGAGDDGVAAWIDEDASGDGDPAGDSVRTVDTQGPGEEPIPEAPSETVAVEESISAGEDFDVSVERAATFEDITPADPATAIHGGMFVQQDDIARLIKKLAVDIAYRREDLFASIREKTDAAYSEQVRLQNVLAVTGESIADRFNEQQAIIADLIERKARIDRFADDARRGLEGKTLDYLQTVDVGALPWPL